MAIPPARFGIAYGSLIVGIALFAPWIWLVWLDRRLRRKR